MMSSSIYKTIEKVKSKNFNTKERVRVQMK